MTSSTGSSHSPPKNSTSLSEAASATADPNTRAVGGLHCSTTSTEPFSASTSLNLARSASMVSPSPASFLASRRSSFSSRLAFFFSVLMCPTPGLEPRLFLRLSRPLPIGWIRMP
jgi:hypothetical protein